MVIKQIFCVTKSLGSWWILGMTELLETNIRFHTERMYLEIQYHAKKLQNATHTTNDISKFWCLPCHTAHAYATLKLQSNTTSKPNNYLPGSQWALTTDSEDQAFNLSTSPSTSFSFSFFIFPSLVKACNCFSNCDGKRR